MARYTPLRVILTGSKLTLASRLASRETAAAASRLFCSSKGNGNIIDPDDLTPPIPEYVEKTGETVGLKRARLLYQSRKRGMLENGLLLSTFAGKFLDSFTPEQLNTYDNLINRPTNDWEIYYWMTEVKETPAEFQSDIMDLLKKHVKNENRDVRIQQPDL